MTSEEVAALERKERGEMEEGDAEKVADLSSVSLSGGAGSKRKGAPSAVGGASSKKARSGAAPAVKDPNIDHAAGDDG